MRKNLSFVVLAAVLLTSGCNKYGIDSNSAEGSNFRIYLSGVETKTVNDGLSTKWENGDRLMVYHAVAGTTEYVKDGNGRYDISDAEKGEATPITSPSLSEGNYDWYVYYRWASANTVTKSQAQILSQAPGASLLQIGNSSTEHLAGLMFPVYGIAKNVPSSENPTVKMKHIATVFEFKVTSSLPQIQIKKIVLTAPASASIVGSFYINYSSDTPVLTPNTIMVGNEAALEVDNADFISSGNNASFYLGTAPFALNTGEEIDITVTAYDGENDGTQTFHYTATSDIEFKSGKIRPIELTISELTPIPEEDPDSGMMD